MWNVIKGYENIGKLVAFAKSMRGESETSCLIPLSLFERPSWCRKRFPSRKDQKRERERRGRGTKREKEEENEKKKERRLRCKRRRWRTELVRVLGAGESFAGSFSTHGQAGIGKRALVGNEQGRGLKLVSKAESEREGEGKRHG